MPGYRDLIVWQRSMDLACSAYDCTDSFPAMERYGLVSQIRRSAVSVVCNIAEGQGRASVGEFLNQLSVARGSLQELETLLIIADRRGYLTSVVVTALLKETSEISRMLKQLRRALARKR